MICRISDNKIFVHYLLPAILSILYFSVSLADVYCFRVNNWDYGIFSNLLYNFANGNYWHMSLYQGQPREFFLADHLVLLTPLFSIPFIVCPSPYTLSILHNFAFASIFFLVPIFVKIVFTQNGNTNYALYAIFLLLILAFSPGFVGAWKFQSHMTTLSAPFLLLALISLHKRKFIYTAIFCLIVALAQERASVAVFSIGMYAILVTKNYKLGAFLCIFSTLYFFIAVKILIPIFGNGTYMYDRHINFFANINQKVLFVAKLFMGWFFIILVGKRALLSTLCVIPIISIGLVSSRVAMYTFDFQYQDLPSIILFVAATHGAATLYQLSFSTKKLLAIFTIVLCVSLPFMYKDFIRSNPFYRLYLLTKQEHVSALHNTINNINLIIDNDASVYSTSGIGTYFAMRKNLHHIDKENSKSKFTNSIICISPTIDIYPYSNVELEIIIENLKNNKSVQLLQMNEHIVVFSTNNYIHQNL